MVIAIYARQSKFNNQSESIENQISICTNHCNKLFPDATINIYKDKGYSGKNTSRPGLEELKSDIISKKINFVITYKLDRLSRSVKDFIDIIDLFKNNRVNFISVKENFDLDSPTGKIIALIHSIFSELERDSIRERICDNMYESAKSGRYLGGPAPLGYKFLRVEENGKCKSYLQIDDDSIDTVKYIYNNFLRLKSLTQVRNLALKNKILGPRGNPLDLSTISNILRSCIYVKSSSDVVDFLKNKNMNVFGTPDNHSGFLTYGKKSNLTDKAIATISKHPGIIDAETWLEVQSILKENESKAPRQGTGKTALLSGILKCKICGSNMRISYKKSKSNNKESSYYICGKKKSHGKIACSCSNLSASYIDKFILDYINNVDINKIIDLYDNDNLFTNNICVGKKELDMINKSIKDKDKKMNALTNRLGLTDNEIILNNIIKNMEILAKDIEELKVKQRNLKDKIHNVSQKDINAISYCINKFDVFLNNQHIDYKREFIKSIISEIIWDPHLNTINIIFKKI